MNIKTPEELEKILPSVLQNSRDKVLSKINEKLELGLNYVEVSSVYYPAMPSVVESMKERGWKCTYYREFRTGAFMDIYWHKLSNAPKTKSWWKFW